MVIGVYKESFTRNAMLLNGKSKRMVANLTLILHLCCVRHNKILFSRVLEGFVLHLSLLMCSHGFFFFLDYFNLYFIYLFAELQAKFFFFPPWVFF
jgi:hypothetical protein